MPRSTHTDNADDYTTLQVAQLLGLAVRSVQLMVDRGELQGWKTPGGHRRISRVSVDRALAAQRRPGRQPGPEARHPKVLLIEDSAHYQNLITLLVRQQFPGVDLQVASDGITGLAMFGRTEPDVLVVDILLPGIDGAALVASLRSSPQFRGCRLLVITSLDQVQRAPFAYALDGLPVVHKDRLVAELPPLLAKCLDQAPPRT
jgi:excisionase family DNA binding protein